MACGMIKWIMIYRVCDMIYSLNEYDIFFAMRKYEIISVTLYTEGIYHRTIVRHHIEDISPVPQGTDIIEKILVKDEDFFWGG